jgi:hypothetical protein
MSRRLILNGVVLAGLLILAALALKYAQHAALISPSAAGSGGQIAIGLALAAYANFMPKRLASGRRQTALRVSGWAFMIAGLADAALWAFAPQSLAWPASMAAVGTATAVCLVFTVWACAARA